MIFKMSSSAIVLVVLVLMSLVEGIPPGCNVLHRAIDGCENREVRGWADKSGKSLQACLIVGFSVLDMRSGIDVDAFMELTKAHQQSNDTFYREFEACKLNGGFLDTLKCQYQSATALAEVLGCLN